MKKAKLIKSNKQEQKPIENETYSIKNLLLIIVIITTVLGIFYLITILVVQPAEENNTSNTVTEIDSTKITLNHLLDRKEDEYYVLATKKTLYDEYGSKINYSELYNNYVSSYSSIENSLPFYYVDLDDALNKNYLSDELNISDNISEIKLNNEALFKIKNSQIEEYYVGSSDILETLKKLSN